MSKKVTLDYDEWMLEKCEMQFVGFRQGASDPFSIIELVKSMGLKKSEWEKIKKKTPCLDRSDVIMIDDYFSGDKK